MKSLLKKEISVIVPAFNEGGSIGKLLKRLSASLSKEKYKYEIIVVDDHSTDKTVSLVKKAARLAKARIVAKKGKRGKAYSIVEGIAASKFRNIAFIDADLQYPPEEIVEMVKKLKEADIVSANRKQYKDSAIRRFFSRSFRYGFGKLMYGLDHDIQAGLKVFKKEVATTLSFNPSSQWTFDLEFLHSAREAGFKIANHDITFGKREKGDSKIGILKTSYEMGLSALKLRVSPMHPRMVEPKIKRSMMGAGVRYKRNKYITHSTLPWEKSSLRTFTRLQKFNILLTVGVFFLGFIINTQLTLIFLVGVLSLIYFVDTVFNFFIVIKSLKSPQEIKVSKKSIDSLDEAKLPVYTILCPLYKEAHIIPQFVKNISKLSWPHDKLDVQLLLEEDDKESIAKVKRMTLPSYVRAVTVPHSQPKTKPKACNYGLSHAKGDFLVIYDAEDMPDPLQLKKAFIAFSKVKKEIKCLQAKLNYYNPSQNLLTRFFTSEYSLWFDVTLTGLQSVNTSIPLGGTSNHFKVKDLRELKGWDSFNVTEDADLGTRLFKDGYKTAIIDSVTLEEANSKWGNWLRQRSRWIKGYMQTYLVHTRNTFSFAKNHGIHFPLFHLIIGGKIAFILINPFLWIATISYFALYQYVGPAIERLYPAPIFYMAAFSLVFGNFLFMYYYMIGVMKRGQYSLVKYTFLIPFYWIMISIAGFIALYQLFFKPFYWEKTVHGLHLAKQKRKVKQVVKPTILPQPVFPRPAVPFGWALKAFTNPLITIGNIERAGINAFAVTMIFIGEMEKRALKGSMLVFKKAIVTPFKYASSILS